MLERTVDGTAFERFGDKNNPTVILIHGLGLNRDVWNSQVPALAEAYHVIVYDLYWHGETPPPSSMPSLSVFAAQLSILMDHCKINRAAFIGFSLGGMIARRFAQDKPLQTVALAILNSPYKRSKDAQDAIIKRVKLAGKEGPSATVEAALQRWFTDKFREMHPKLMDQVRKWVMSNDPETYPSVYHVLAEGIDEIVAPNPPISCPALVLTGDEDYGNGPEMTHAIAAEIEGAETVILNGLRHMALMEEPAAVNIPLLSFLGKVFDKEAHNDGHLQPSKKQTYSNEEKRDLRNALGTFATGVTIVTTVEKDGTPRGFTANSFTSVSLDPPLVLVCIGKFSESLQIFERGQGFAVNILSENQKDIAGIFAAPRPDKFGHVKWEVGTVGMPLIKGALSWFECTRDNVIDAGDHIILIGRVQDYAYQKGQPLGYVNGGYFTLEGGGTLLKAAKKNAGMVVGAVLSNDKGILFHGDSNAPVLTLPNNVLCQVEATPAALSKALHNKNLTVSLDFLLSAYDDKPSGKFKIYYRGEAIGSAPLGMHFYPIDDIPFDRITDKATRFMLRRYVTELGQGRFSIYHGDDTSGETRNVDLTPRESHV